REVGGCLLDLGAGQMGSFTQKCLLQQLRSEAPGRPVGISVLQIGAVLLVHDRIVPPQALAKTRASGGVVGPRPGERAGSGSGDGTAAGSRAASRGGAESAAAALVVLFGQPEDDALDLFDLGHVGE